MAKNKEDMRTRFSICGKMSCIGWKASSFEIWIFWGTYNSALDQNMNEAKLNYLQSVT
jgi:hypothetical protein